MMSKPDTNQASEDMVDDFYSLPPTSRTKANLRDYIRTEKLKLLAEVRERVIGEDYDIPAEMEKVGRDFQKLDAIAKTGGLLNKFKADLRTKLTKLEAEL